MSRAVQYTRAAVAVIEVTTEESAILAAYKASEKHGLDFGRLCYEYREKYSAQGSRTGGGLRPMLEKVGIPSSTAYFWIERYELVIGVRQPKQEPTPEPETLEEGEAHTPPVPLLQPAKPQPAPHVEITPAEDVLTVPVDTEMPNVVAITIKVGSILEFNGRLYEVKAGWRNDPDDKHEPAVLTPYLKFMWVHRGGAA